MPAHVGTATPSDGVGGSTSLGPKAIVLR
jgi:hypothetical protein